MEKNKRAALELSIGTIVVIVIAMSMLILGIVLVRQVMCSGIILTDQITKATENEIKNLFGSTESGVKCMGEAGDEVKLGSGGRRQIVCVVNPDRQQKFKLELDESKSIFNRGRLFSYQNGDRLTEGPLIVDSGWEGTASPGKKTVTVAVLDVPRDIDSSNIKLVFDEYRTEAGNNFQNNPIETHSLSIDLQPVNIFTAAIC